MNHVSRAAARIGFAVIAFALLLIAFASTTHAQNPTPPPNEPERGLIYDGLEICSGTQRIHIPEILEKQLKAKNLNPKNFKFYIDAFRYGAPEHSGWSVGLERLTMRVCGKSNIREVTMFPRDRNRITP